MMHRNGWKLTRDLECENLTAQRESPSVEVAVRGIPASARQPLREERSNREIRDGVHRRLDRLG